MNGVEKSDVGIPNTFQGQYPVIYTQEHSETQLHTVRVSETAKALGFTTSLFDVVCMEGAAFFYGFRTLIESVLPNLRRYNHFFYIDTYGSVRKPNLPGLETAKLTLMVRLGMQIAFGRVRRKTAPTVLATNGNLLPYQHFTRCREITRSQRIKIDTTRNRFPQFITTTPICSTARVRIDASSLMS